MSDGNKLKKARMAMAQAVNRSLDADTLAERRDVDIHRAAAEKYLREAGREDLGFRLKHDLPASSTEARQNMRQLMQLVDADLEPSVEVKHGFEPIEPIEPVATDGGNQ